MEPYQYKPILSLDQIAKYNRNRQWVVGIFIVLFLAAATVASGYSKPKWDAEMSPEASASFYAIAILFAGFFCTLRFIPNCRPIIAKQAAQLLSWREQFNEVDTRVLSIFNERDYITQYEFEEIKKRVALLSGHSLIGSPERARLLRLSQKISVLDKHLKTLLGKRRYIKLYEVDEIEKRLLALTEKAPDAD